MTEMDPIRDWHQVAVEMLLTDADLALQSITYLFEGDDKESVTRIVRSTREVYDSILAKRGKITLSASDTTTLDNKIDRLRARLKFMGEAV